MTESRVHALPIVDQFDFPVSPFSVAGYLRNTPKPARFRAR